MRKLATIRKIKEIYPIPNADRIEVAVIDGWQCIVNKSDGFKVGDLVVYIEIDSVLPDKPEFEFMRKYKFRVKTIKLRGQVSQGLVLPISVLGTNPYCEGADVTETLGIKKYDPESAQEKVWWQKLAVQNKIEFPWWLKPFKRIGFIRNWWINKHKTVDDFPDFIKKTDEERIQNMPILFDSLKKRGIVLCVTEKLDGTSATYFLKDGKFGVCSRNKWILKEDDSPYWQMAKKYEIEQFLRGVYDSFYHKPKLLVLQGEIIGHGIQSNKYHMSDRSLFAFNFIIDGKRCDYHDMKEYLEYSSINVVPDLGNIIVLPNQEIQDLVELSKGRSLYRDGKEPREGIVCRNELEHVSFKVINPDFLLKEED